MYNKVYPQIAHSISNACSLIGIGKSKLYIELAEDRLSAKRLGSRTLILDEELRRYIAALPGWDPENPKGDKRTVHQ